MHLKLQMAQNNSHGMCVRACVWISRVRAVCLQNRWVVASGECKVCRQVTTEGHVLKVLQKLGNTDLRVQVSCAKRDAPICPVLIVLALVLRSLRVHARR